MLLIFFPITSFWQMKHIVILLAIDLLENCLETKSLNSRKNEMKSNDDKCHLIVANNENISLNLECDTIESSDTVKFLGFFIDKKTRF